MVLQVIKGEPLFPLKKESAVHVTKAHVKVTAVWHSTAAVQLSLVSAQGCDPNFYLGWQPSNNDAFLSLNYQYTPTLQVAPPTLHSSSLTQAICSKTISHSEKYLPSLKWYQHFLNPKLPFSSLFLTPFFTRSWLMLLPDSSSPVIFSAIYQVSNPRQSKSRFSYPPLMQISIA